MAKSKNATFLFHRDFMEYHQHRFEDYSLLIYNKNKLVALLPANVKDDILYTHQGLSYGGFLLSENISFSSVLESFQSALKFLSDNKINKLVIKQLPKIYLSVPSDELDYFLFILKANLFRRDVSMAIDLEKKIKYSKLRKREINKAKREKLRLEEGEEFSLFWNEILAPNLKEKYGVLPLHTIDEISNLKLKFPDNIRQFNVFDGDKILAGCTVFETEGVAHLQYISTNKLVKKGALDYLIHHLITKIYTGKKYLDFGISNENQGKQINSGLLKWKQSFGASPIVHDFYEVDVEKYSLLKTIMI
ncbi:GNAT family N-acetyltransferase [Algibacter aquimarinus]